MGTDKADNSTFIWVAIPFFTLALTMGLAMNNWALGLPFGALALTFLVIGLSKPSKPKADDSAGTGEN
ncbi:MAG: ABC-type sugar transport system, permease component [Microbacterium sp.]|jgi:hypothetical protein|nr:ABC-type sugar transport system, permease component [Microbacterium sp.]